MVLFGLYSKSFQIRPNPPLSIHVLFSLPGMCLFYGQAPPYLPSLLILPPLCHGGFTYHHGISHPV